MGEDSINAIMPKKNGKNRLYKSFEKLTNDRRRKTVVRKMKASWIPKCEIINVTGHRHESGLDPNDPGDGNEQRFCSSVIDKVPFVPVTQSIVSAFFCCSTKSVSTGPVTKKLCSYYCQTK